MNRSQVLSTLGALGLVGVMKRPTLHRRHPLTCNGWSDPYDWCINQDGYEQYYSQGFLGLQSGYTQNGSGGAWGIATGNYLNAKAKIKFVPSIALQWCDHGGSPQGCPDYKRATIITPDQTYPPSYPSWRAYFLDVLKDYGFFPWGVNGLKAVDGNGNVTGTFEVVLGQYGPDAHATLYGQEYPGGKQDFYVPCPPLYGNMSSILQSMVSEKCVEDWLLLGAAIIGAIASSGLFVVAAMLVLLAAIMAIHSDRCNRQ